MVRIYPGMTIPSTWTIRGVAYMPTQDIFAMTVESDEAVFDYKDGHTLRSYWTVEAFYKEVSEAIKGASK